MDSKKTYNITKGKKNNCFFIIPSIISTTYKQKTWNSETKSIVIGFLYFYLQIDIININKDIDSSITQQTIQVISKTLNEKGYYVKDIESLQKYLKQNKNIVLLIKNSNVEHKYLKETLFNIIKFNDFIKEIKK